MSGKPGSTDVMRTLRVVLAGLLFVSTAAAQQHARGCITPRAKTLPNGHLDRQFINIYFHPSDKNGVYVKIAAPLSLYVDPQEGTCDRASFALSD